MDATIQAQGADIRALAAGCVQVIYPDGTRQEVAVREGDVVTVYILGREPVQWLVGGAR